MGKGYSLADSLKNINKKVEPKVIKKEKTTPKKEKITPKKVIKEEEE